MHDASGKALELRLEFPNGLPPKPEFEPGIRRAPNRGQVLNEKEMVLALKNALRYIPEKYHKEIAPEFLEESTATVSVRRDGSTESPSANIREIASRARPSR